ncbi:MAG: hypothetical protein UHM23_03770 [Clostridia bacterium]|jgi:hypothetical protein|nr:hypothetical protein [Clostridia bacterium]
MANDKIEQAIKLLNENNYIVLPITKGQMFLCDECNQPENECRYSTLGYTCSNLLCLNKFIKEQIDIDSIIHTQDTES